MCRTAFCAVLFFVLFCFCAALLFVLFFFSALLRAASRCVRILFPEYRSACTGSGRFPGKEKALRLLLCKRRKAYTSAHAVPLFFTVVRALCRIRASLSCQSKPQLCPLAASFSAQPRMYIRARITVGIRLHLLTSRFRSSIPPGTVRAAAPGAVPPDSCTALHRPAALCTTPQMYSSPSSLLLVKR